MTTALRIGTWNLEYAAGKRDLRRQLKDDLVRAGAHPAADILRTALRRD